MPEPATESYGDFITGKSQADSDGGFEPTWMPDAAFDFQSAITAWSLRKGRSAMFMDCGMGKSLCQLAWAENVVRHTNGRTLILTPLAVADQTVAEGEKFGVESERSRDGASAARIVVTNYERLHHFDPAHFSGIVCDESSILKHATGATQKAVTRFALKIPYRLLATATAAPNDFIELGTSSEALGGLGHSEMLTRFFKQSDKKQSRRDDVKDSQRRREEVQGGNHFGKLAFRVSQTIGQWRMKGHAVEPFWKWVASWARAARRPSDLGAFSDARYILPALIENEHVVHPARPADGMLFTLPAFGLQEEREERRRTLTERCDLAARLVDHSRPAIVWCHMNDEGDLLEKLIPGCVQIAGRHDDDEKEERFARFLSGESRVLVTKPKIGCWGLNFQHCNHVVTFASHSYEQYYQQVRRCWRFGQERPVTVDIISTEGETRVRDSMRRKAAQADEMFDALVQYMRSAESLSTARFDTQPLQVPSWL